LPTCSGACESHSYLLISCFFDLPVNKRDLHSFPTRRSSDLTIDNELKKLIAENKEVEAVKRYRITTGAGLVEAKKYIDSLNQQEDRKSTRLNSSHVSISYAAFCLKNKNSSRCLARRDLRPRA